MADHGGGQFRRESGPRGGGHATHPSPQAPAVPRPGPCRPSGLYSRCHGAGRACRHFPQGSRARRRHGTHCRRRDHGARCGGPRGTRLPPSRAGACARAGIHFCRRSRSATSRPLPPVRRASFSAVFAARSNRQRGRASTWHAVFDRLRGEGGAIWRTCQRQNDAGSSAICGPTGMCTVSALRRRWRPSSTAAFPPAHCTSMQPRSPVLFSGRTARSPWHFARAGADNRSRSITMLWW